MPGDWSYLLFRRFFLGFELVYLVVANYFAQGYDLRSAILTCSSPGRRVVWPMADDDVEDSVSLPEFRALMIEQLKLYLIKNVRYVCVQFETFTFVY